MNYNVIVSDEALFDITETSFWYDGKEHGLAKKIQQEIKNSIAYLSKEPQTLQKRYKNVYIYFIKVFPYGIHYIIDKNTVKVIGVFHTSKNPKNWIGRM